MTRSITYAGIHKARDEYAIQRDRDGHNRADHDLLSISE